MNITLKSMIAAGLLFVSGLAFADEAIKISVPTSEDLLTPETFTKLREDPKTKRAIEFTMDMFNKSGTLVMCDTPKDIGLSIALTFYGVPYRVAHMVAIPSPDKNTSGKVCVSIEKPKN